MQNIKMKKFQKINLLTILFGGVIGVMIMAFGAFLWVKAAADIESLKPAPNFASNNIVDIGIIPDGVPESILQKARDKSEGLTVADYDKAIFLAYHQCEKLVNNKEHFQFSSELSNACFLAKQLAAAQIESTKTK